MLLAGEDALYEWQSCKNTTGLRKQRHSQFISRQQSRRREDIDKATHDVLVIRIRLCYNHPYDRFLKDSVFVFRNNLQNAASDRGGSAYNGRTGRVADDPRIYIGHSEQSRSIHPFRKDKEHPLCRLRQSLEGNETNRRQTGIRAESQFTCKVMRVSSHAKIDQPSYQEPASGEKGQTHDRCFLVLNESRPPSRNLGLLKDHQSHVPAD